MEELRPVGGDEVGDEPLAGVAGAEAGKQYRGGDRAREDPEEYQTGERAGEEQQVQEHQLHEEPQPVHEAAGPARRFIPSHGQAPWVPE